MTLSRTMNNFPPLLPLLSLLPCSVKEHAVTLFREDPSALFDLSHLSTCWRENSHLSPTPRPRKKSKKCARSIAPFQSHLYPALTAPLSARGRAFHLKWPLGACQAVEGTRQTSHKVCPAKSAPWPWRRDITRLFLSIMAAMFEISGSRGSRGCRAR